VSAQGWQRPRSSKKGQSEANTIPIAEVIKYYGGEVKEGRAANIRCFMHNDSRSSAVLNTYDNLVYCHTCGKGGNAVSVVMIMENLEFKDALKRALEITAGSGQSLRGSNRRANTRVSKRTWNI
jgi:DNA primase